jgi:MFS family permease
MPVIGPQKMGCLTFLLVGLFSRTSTHREDKKEETMTNKRSVPLTTDAGEPQSHDSYAALRYRNFCILQICAFVAVFAQQMITVAIGWELFERTNSALVLGGIGLAQIIPIIVLFLPSGYIVDLYSRKMIFLVSLALLGLASLGLAILSALHGSLWLIYACLAVMGGAQSFSSPASAVLVSQVVPEQVFENATAWRTSSGHLASVLGPASGGFLIALFNGATFVYVLSAVAFVIISLLMITLHVRSQVEQQKGVQTRSFKAVVEGLQFLGRTQVMLAAMTLDLFAVLFGGATTLLPVFARDILHVGSIGLGWLQAADSVGAVGMALLLAHRPPFRHAGRTLFLAITGFGIATIVFGLSRWFWLSFLMLFVLGGLDNINMLIRGTLALVRTPDQMRGRVSAVTSLFVGTSNQLGGFESGLAAQLLGPVLAVVLGGVGTIVVVVAVALAWPELRRLSSIRESSDNYESSQTL